MSRRTRSKLALTTTKVKLSKVLITGLADYVIDHPTAKCKIYDDNETCVEDAALNSETGQMMEFRHLMSHKNPKIRITWS